MYGERLPDIPTWEPVLSYWFELGLCGRGGDGVGLPFSWVEVDAFARMAGHVIEPLEASCLVDMSRAYAKALSDDNPLSIAPMDRP
jgi:hypothetical protein